MKLILTRHAKSSWDDFTLDDHDRPLNDRGRKSASLVGNWLQSHGHVPTTILSSTAERAKWTTALAAEEMEPRPKISFHSGLYHASEDVILKILRSAPEGDVMVVGHNPGFAHFARMIVKEPPAHPDFSRYPTAATVVVEVDLTEWRGLGFGTGRAVSFAVPRELDDG